MARVYMDHAASGMVRPAARNAMLAALDACGNPSSVHAEGQRARLIVEDARRAVAGFLNVRPEQVVFTSGGTEANNLALRGVGGGLVTSGIEHDCVLKTARALGGVIVGAAPDGGVDMAALEDALKAGGVKLVSMMHANNETGVLQPLEDVVALARKHGVPVHTDAVQTVGHMPVDFGALGVDMLTLSGHKFGAPMGVGALVLKPEVRFSPQITGGAQERNRRAGTENVAAIAGLGVAVAELAETGDAEWGRLQALGGLMDALLADTAGVDMVAPDSSKVPHVRQVRVRGRRGEDVVIAMDLAGVAVSQGSACGSGRTAASHVLQAMGWDETTAGEVVRLSLGWNTTEDDVRAAVAALAWVAG